MAGEGADTNSTYSSHAGARRLPHLEASCNALIRKEQSMQLGFLVQRRRRVSLMAVFIVLLAVVVGSAAALAALTPSPGSLRGKAGAPIGQTGSFKQS
jgi:hypothetical protein